MFAKTRRSQREAVTYTQILINMLAGTKLKADGIIGPASRVAYSQLTPDQKTMVSNYLKQSGHDVSLFELNVQSPSLPNSGSSASRREIEKKIVSVAREHGVHPNLALTICNVESRFNHAARSSTGAAGLFQLTNIAIDDVALNGGGPLYNMKAQTRAHRDYVKSDMDANILYGVLYIKRACVLLRSQGVKVYPSTSNVSEWALIYGGFNVGAKSIRTMLDLQAGKKVSDSNIADARDKVSKQAADLKRDGVYGYISNTHRWISTQVV